MVVSLGATAGVAVFALLPPPDVPVEVPVVLPVLLPVLPPVVPLLLPPVVPPLSLPPVFSSTSSAFAATGVTAVRLFQA